MEWWRKTGVWLGVALSTAGFLSSCGPSGPVRPNLPPSESDLTLLKSTALCDRKPDFETKLPAAPKEGRPWGAGQEVQIPGSRSATHADESYFFDEDGLLVGALFTFPRGLDLAPYPVLRHTLSLLKPTNEFYLAVPLLPTKANMDTSALFETGDEKSTTQYLVTGTRDTPVLLQASFTIDPYVRLFSPYRREFLARLKQPAGTNGGPAADGQGSEDKEPFRSLHEFARGQTAQLAYCGDKNYDVALDAYQKAAASGFTNKVWQAEAHHKLGQAWQAKGQFEKAKAEMEKSLAIRPNIPEVLNNLGTVHAQMGDKTGALALFERAVTLRPNYAVARYNLAEAYEATNPKRALSEYETFLVLVEGIPEEEGRAARAKERVRMLKPEPKR
jgi:tetratricopeptide (TPR) repeat protein